MHLTPHVPVHGKVGSMCAYKHIYIYINIFLDIYIYVDQGLKVEGLVLTPTHDPARAV